MEIRKSKGVQQQDVWAAADALIADGLRPTIERVRHKMGRGSPNTVSPILDAWFASLGSRLNGELASSKAANSVPDSVSRAMTDIWQTALSVAQEDVAASFLGEQQVLDQRRAELLTIQIELEQQQKTQLLREAAVNETLSMAKDQLTLSVAQVKQLQAVVIQRDKTLEESQTGLENLTRQRESERKHYEEQVKAQVQALVRAEERSSASERRLLLDIDRLRQEVKLAQTTKLEAERRHAVLHADWEVSNSSLLQKIKDVDFEGIALQEKLRASEMRATDLQLLLQAQAMTTQAVLAGVGRISLKPGPRRRVSPFKK